MLLSDVDMDILTDTPPTPPWSQWNTICTPVPPFHHNTFPPDSIWETPVQEIPPPATQYRSGFDAPNAPSFRAAALAHWDTASNDSFVSAVPEPPVYFSNLNLLPPVYHPCAPYAMSDRIQDTAKMHWQEPPHRVATPHPSSIATLLDEFERSLTLVADEPPSFEADNQGDYVRHFNLPPAHMIEDELQIHPPRPNDSCAPLATLDPARSNDHSDDPHPFEREATEPLGEGQGHTPACFLNLHEPFEEESTAQPPGDPPPFEREPNVPLKKSENPPADLADPPLLGPVPFPTYTVPGPPIPRAPRAAHPFTSPRPPTPPPSRRPSKPASRHNTRATHHHHSAITSKTDRAELPVAQASVQASKSAQLQPRLGAARVPLPPPCRAQVLGDDEVGGGGGGSGWGVPPGRRTALGAARRPPAPVRCSRRRREEADDDEGKERRPERRVRTKRTRFVTPDAEDEGEEDVKATPGARPPGPDSNRRTSGPGPLRSILRNKHAMPYDKAMVRHVRRASVP